MDGIREVVAWALAFWEAAAARLREALAASGAEDTLSRLGDGLAGFGAPAWLGAYGASAACAAITLMALLSRRWIAAVACASCALAAAPVGASAAPANTSALLVVVAALVLALAWRDRRRAERLVDTIADREETIRSLRNSLRAERFWRFATGDERGSLPDEEVLELARRLQETITVTPKPPEDDRDVRAEEADEPMAKVAAIVERSKRRAS